MRKSMGGGASLVSAPSQAVDVGLSRTATSFAYESAGVDLCRLVSGLSRMHIFTRVVASVSFFH